MTDKANPNEPNDLVRFLQDWTALWREEQQAQANDPDGTPGAILAGLLPAMANGVASRGAASPDIAAAMETSHAAMVAWAEAMGAEAMGAEAMGAEAMGAEAMGANAMEADTGPTGTLGVPPAIMAASGEPSATSRAQAAAAASDPRDAEIDRLARRVDALEARLAKLETTRRRRG